MDCFWFFMIFIVGPASFLLIFNGKDDEDGCEDSPEDM